MDRIQGGKPAQASVDRLAPRLPSAFPLPPRLPAGNDHTAAGAARRRAVLERQGLRVPHLAGAEGNPAPETLAGNIENFLGFARVPVGIVGPLRINGVHAHGDYYVPLATSEGALVASYHRGAYAISQAGGAAVACLTESVSRAPCFQFGSLAEAGQFVDWVVRESGALEGVVAAHSRHARLGDVRPALVGRDVYLCFEYETGDAAGQNMVTLVTEALCAHLLAKAPVRPRHWFLEGNLSGDKKATMLAFLSARGKKVIAEAVIGPALLRRLLHTDAALLMRYWQVSVIGGVQSGSIGTQGHVANALAALFIACGQDAACVAEAAVGVTRLEAEPDGGVYISVTLPSLIVGTVGGGTHLPTARECLELLGCYGAGRARAFAEICAATALAGELSIMAALAAGEFAAAHARYGRKPAAGGPAAAAGGGGAT